VKGIVKRALQSVGLDLIRYQPPIERGFPVLPYLVRERLTPDFFFVQIGANDGVQGDPIHDLILQYDLAGLLIEPLPEHFLRLQAHYKGCVKLRFENVAISSEEGQLPLYRVRPNTPGAAPWWYEIASFDSHVLAAHDIPADVIETLAVRTTTFEALLAKHRLNRVDLLQVDTEGHDGVIVRAALTSGFKPGIINYESCHLPPDERYQIKQLLAANDYCFIDIGRDTLAVRFEAHRGGAAA
jgi:FkbM family methyltransferase